MLLFNRMGEGLPKDKADLRRAEFLRQLIRDSKNGFAASMVQIEPCDPVAAYFMFVAVTGCLGVNIDVAARRLERLVRAQ
jgi:hypothetical protein